jgi:hypothetical protein
LYAQFLAGLNVTADHPVTDGKEERSTVAMIVADRKQRWKARCAESPEVQYWQQCQDRLKAQYGANAEVDGLVIADQEVDIRRYFQGKQRREELLAECGLAREGSSLIPLDVDDADSQAGGQPHAQPAKAGSSTASGGDPTQQLVHLLTALVARQEQVEKALGIQPAKDGPEAKGDPKAPAKKPAGPPS